MDLDNVFQNECSLWGKIFISNLVLFLSKSFNKLLRQRDYS